ncbi:MAG: sigma-54 dependent transcriptional regulator [Gemmataceae bacterium]|nr:sigma-54 dependent transcriptional regulator [Gemmataceae bacterium]MDW8265231.1 sigma-54 dependent transcriptional regulator [Gemmataceae bacterium]
MATSPHLSLRILFADDEKALQELMRAELPRLGHEVTVCPDGKSAIKALEKGSFDAAILDLRMPGLNGIEVLEQLKQIAPDTEAIVLTGHGSMETAIEAMRLGAFDYVTKPCKLAEIEAILRKVAEKRQLTNKNLALQTRVQAAEGPTVLVGSSPSMQSVHRLIATVAPTDSTVLILGETGTGKELVARTLYLQSKRAHMPFVPVNCGALSENLVESELFGHVKGAFTGAERDHKGLFEVANGGTLFLDEVGELNKNIQVKLLRFLESGEIRRVGDTRPFKTDVRVLCATNRDLREMIARDEFREDLYFRINTFEIRLPPLRERRADIPDLARHLLARAARRPVEQVAELLSPEAIDVLLEHHWPGNVRELANVMEHALILAGGQRIGPEHLPHHIRVGSVAAPLAGKVAAAAPAAAATGPRTLRDVEMEHILRVVHKHGGNKSKAAEELGISLKTLYNKLNQLDEERRSAG